MSAANMAVRHPKRGKSHRKDSSRKGWSGTGYTETICGLELKNLTESVPVEQTAPEDRCARCFPGSAVRS